MREHTVNGVMQEGLVRRFQRRPGSDPLQPSRRRAGPIMSSVEDRPTTAGSPRGRVPLGGPGRRAVPAMIAGFAVAVAAVAGLALSGADVLAAVCAAALALAALAIGWGFGERGMASLEAEVESSTSELKRALSE